MPADAAGEPARATRDMQRRTAVRTTAAARVHEWQAERRRKGQQPQHQTHRRKDRQADNRQAKKQEGRAAAGGDFFTKPIRTNWRGLHSLTPKHDAPTMSTAAVVTLAVVGAIQAILVAAIGVLGAVLIARITKGQTQAAVEVATVAVKAAEVATKLEEANVKSDEKVDNLTNIAEGLVVVVDKVHTLTNSGMGLVLAKNKKLARELADAKPTPENQKAAEEADMDYKTHMGKQGIVDEEEEEQQRDSPT